MLEITAVYPDCRQEFRDADDDAFRVGNWEAERVGYFTPYLQTDKFGILQDGLILCDMN
jgi:7-cyano-7-deazaguanine synthase